MSSLNIYVPQTVVLTFVLMVSLSVILLFFFTHAYHFIFLYLKLRKDLNKHECQMFRGKLLKENPENKTFKICSSNKCQWNSSKKCSLHQTGSQEKLCKKIVFRYECVWSCIPTEDKWLEQHLPALTEKLASRVHFVCSFHRYHLQKAWTHLFLTSPLPVVG